GQIDVGLVALGDLADDLTGRRVDGRELLAADGIDPLPADEHLLIGDLRRGLLRLRGGGRGHERGPFGGEGKRGDPAGSVRESGTESTADGRPAGPARVSHSFLRL